MTPSTCQHSFLVSPAHPRPSLLLDLDDFLHLFRVEPLCKRGEDGDGDGDGDDPGHAHVTTIIVSRAARLQTLRLWLLLLKAPVVGRNLAGTKNSEFYSDHAGEGIVDLASKRCAQPSYHLVSTTTTTTTTNTTEAYTLHTTTTTTTTTNTTEAYILHTTTGATILPPARRRARCYR